MKIFLTLCCIALSINFGFSQGTENNKAKKAGDTGHVETMPQFPGGERAMFDFINNNLHYPTKAKEMNTTGRVVARMTVRANGKITDIEILEDIGNECGDSVMSVLRKMPDWIPGTQDGKVVPVYVRIPVNFSLGEDKPKKRKRHGRN